LRVIWDCCINLGGFETKLRPELVVDLCYRLGFAAGECLNEFTCRTFLSNVDCVNDSSLCSIDVIVSPQADTEAIVAKLASEHSGACLPLQKSLALFGQKGLVQKEQFVLWAEQTVPQLPSTLSTFIHNLLFHTKYTHHHLSFVPFQYPTLDQKSSIFQGAHCSNLFALATTSPFLSGKWHNLYSFEYHGNSMNRLQVSLLMSNARRVLNAHYVNLYIILCVALLQYSILGYSGPSVLIIETDLGHIIGAFLNTTWKKSKDYYGDSNAFIFQLYPTLTVFNSTGTENNFICLQDGLGFGGTQEMPRLYIPASMESCNAGVMDKTFKEGQLLPTGALEKFNIKNLEVWGVGGDNNIQQDLKAREEKRALTESTIYQARVIKDKSSLIKDINLLDTKLYKHLDEARGRAEFRVDENHGGYVLERDQ